MFKKILYVMLCLVVFLLILVGCERYTDNKVPTIGSIQVSSTTRFFTYNLENWDWKVDGLLLYLVNKNTGEIVVHSLANGVSWFKVYPFPEGE